MPIVYMERSFVSTCCFVINEFSIIIWRTGCFDKNPKRFVFRWVFSVHESLVLPQRSHKMWKTMLLQSSVLFNVAELEDNPNHYYN